MKIEKRHEAILEHLRVRGAVEVEALAGEFAVTAQTIRNDLRVLGDLGFLRRVHGGARRVASLTARDHAARRRLNACRKEAIGKAAAAIIPGDCSLSLNIGTTTEQVAHALGDHTGLTVLTNNTNIVSLLMGSGCGELIQIGGTVRQSDGAIVGDDAVEFISRYKVDYAVIGASALDADGAVTDFDAREVAVARAFLRNCRKSILVCDASKFDARAPVRICDVGDLDFVVTDRPPPVRFAAAARRGKTKILLAEGCDDQTQ